MKVLSLLFISFFASLSAQAQSKTSWRITQPAWTEAHERKFGEFVAGLGAAVERQTCGTVKDCLKSSANPYFSTDPAGLIYFADCADLPYFLRSYFAWKNGLPMSIISAVESMDPPGTRAKPRRDLKYSENGNYVIKRHDVIAKVNGQSVSYPNALTILNETVPNVTSSAAFRIKGASDDKLFSDFYPVKINRQGIRPGTVIYDPNGHVALVYKVSDDGRVFYIDAHPDNSLTRGMYTPKFVRSSPGQGAGFKNFRPISLAGAQIDASGAYVGGRIVATPNIQLPLFGTEQFSGTHPDPTSWKKGQFFINGQLQGSFHDFVRMSLMRGEMMVDPLVDMQQLTDDICTSLHDRVAAVEAARREGIDKKPHPPTLPENIYGTDGEWEEFSSPSRDARLKVAFMDLLAETKANVQRVQNREKGIRYNGTNIGADLFAVYAERAKACVFAYTTTSGKMVKLNLEAARQRLFNMSFDPYHCIELRWGARIPEEIASCRDNDNKRAWYEREKWLRYQSERRYDARMDFSLGQLTGPLPNVGVVEAPDVDIVGYLKSIQ